MCVLFIYKICMLVFDYTSCRMDKLLLYVCFTLGLMDSIWVFRNLIEIGKSMIMAEIM